MIPVVLLHGVVNAMRFTSINTLTLKDLPEALASGDGLSVCRDLRRFSDVPVIIITAKTEKIDYLLMLEIGADDYICKPYSTREVVARVKTILRRSGNRAHRRTRGRRNSRRRSILMRAISRPATGAVRWT